MALHPLLKPLLIATLPTPRLGLLLPEFDRLLQVGFSDPPPPLLLHLAVLIWTGLDLRCLFVVALQITKQYHSALSKIGLDRQTVAACYQCAMYCSTLRCTSGWKVAVPVVQISQ